MLYWVNSIEFAPLFFLYVTLQRSMRIPHSPPSSPLLFPFLSFLLTLSSILSFFSPSPFSPSSSPFSFPFFCLVPPLLFMPFFLLFSSSLYFNPSLPSSPPPSPCHFLLFFLSPPPPPPFFILPLLFPTVPPPSFLFLFSSCDFSLFRYLPAHLIPSPILSASDPFSSFFPPFSFLPPLPLLSYAFFFVINLNIFEF